MGLVTESELRSAFKNIELSNIKEYRVPEGTIVTPAAKAFLTDRKIKLMIGDGHDISGPESQQSKLGPAIPNDEKSSLPQFEAPKRYETEAGAYYDEKPEHMTAIRGPKLVNKDHPIIRFRGKLDSFESRILEVQIAFARLGMPKVVQDLSEVLAYTREILRCEVLSCPMEDRTLLGMDSDEIRARSHTPKKYYGLNHFAPTFEHGEGVILLNALRTQVREVELSAYDAFKDGYGVPSRTDLIRALNRLSSLFYVMMFRVLAKEYEQ